MKIRNGFMGFRLSRVFSVTPQTVLSVDRVELSGVLKPVRVQVFIEYSFLVQIWRVRGFVFVQRDEE